MAKIFDANVVDEAKSVEKQAVEPVEQLRSFRLEFRQRNKSEH